MRYFRLIAILTICFFCLSGINVFAQSVTLTWAVSQHPDISHYGIYCTTHLDSSFVLIGTVDHPDSIYIDETVELGKQYYYATTSVDQFGNESGFSNMVDTTLSFPTHVDSTTSNPPLPEAIQLFQNYPNPFNPSTTISYLLAKNGHVELIVYNDKGQRVHKLADEFQQAGEHTVVWDGTDQNRKRVASGIYYYKVKAINSAMFRKMILIK